MRSLLPPLAGEVDLDAVYTVVDPGPGNRHVRVNFVVSIDGAAELDGRTAGLGSPPDKTVFDLLRWSCDVVLAGAGTARTEGYGPVSVPEERQQLRMQRGMAVVPRLAVVTRSASLDPSAKLFTPSATGERPLVVTTAQADTSHLTDVAEVVVCGEDLVEPGRLLAALAERGLRRILCEGGPTLFAEIAGAGCVDELCLTVSPLLAGPGHARLFSGLPWLKPAELTLDSVLEQDGVLLLRYVRT